MRYFNKAMLIAYSLGSALPGLIGFFAAGFAENR